ncbi:copper-binding protein (plasmid) [Microvirga sp. VF16]|nr:copper-binding protein [Microvirga sp. VF16]
MSLRKPFVMSAVLIGLAPAVIAAGQAQAQSNMGNMPGMGNTKAQVGQSAPSGMGNMQGMSGGKAEAMTATATGTVASVTQSQRKIKLDHEPIPAFNWPAMSMEMAAAPSIDLSKVKTGSKVRFTVKKGADGTYTVESLSPAQ